MEIYFDDKLIDVAEDKSFRDVICEQGMDSESLKTRPIAARLGGEVYTLSYVPFPSDHKTTNKNNLRKGISAAKGKVKLIRYADEEGKRVYERSLLFIFCLAVRNLFKNGKVIVRFCLEKGVYVDVIKENGLSKEDTILLHKEMQRIVNENHPFVRRRWSTADAEEMFREEGQDDKARLCSWRSFPYFDLYEVEGYHDYFYGEMVPSTGYVSVFDLIYEYGTVIIMPPDHDDFDKPMEYTPYPKVAEAFKRKVEWTEQTHCAVIDDLNDMIRQRTIRDEIRICEARHERQFAEVADMVVERGAKAVMIAGPSSSGKTTSANRLSVELRTRAKHPIMLSLDDYYLDRALMKKEPDGTYDLESIYALDIDLFKKQLKELFEGKEVNIPTFNFKEKKPFYDENKKIKLKENDILVIEGLHGLNPMMCPEGIRKESIFRLYVSPLTSLNMDNHNRIRTTQIRQLRRMVRDFETRGTDIEKTLEMWGSVKRGERKWIFPYQEQADYILDTALPYEPFVLKRYVYPLLMTVKPDSIYYDEIRGIVKFLNYFLEANVEDEIPPTSILREFIGGNTFYK